MCCFTKLNFTWIDQANQCMLPHMGQLRHRLQVGLGKRGEGWKKGSFAAFAFAPYSAELKHPLQSVSQVAPCPSARPGPSSWGLLLGGGGGWTRNEALLVTVLCLHCYSRCTPSQLGPQFQEGKMSAVEGIGKAKASPAEQQLIWKQYS